MNENNKQVKENIKVVNTNNIISVKNLNMHSLGVKILKNVNFEIPKGVVCAFIGPNGAGKTMTMKSILNLYPLQKDLTTRKYPTIRINGILSTDIKSRADVRYVPEKENFVGTTILDFLYEEAAFYNLPKSYTTVLIDEMCDWFGFPKEKLHLKLTKLSSGLKKIIMIIQSFFNNPKLIIMDEPTENLDPSIRTLFWKLVAKKNKEEGVSFLISSHNLDEIEKFVNYIVLIRNGEIKYAGPWKYTGGGLRSKYDEFVLKGDVSQFFKKEDDMSRYNNLLDKGLISNEEYKSLVARIKSHNF